MANQAHLQAIISAVDRLSPVLNKIGVNTVKTKALLTSMSALNFNRLRGVSNMVGKSIADIGTAARNTTGQLLPLVGLGGVGLAGLGFGFVAASRGAASYAAGVQDAVDITGVEFEELQRLQGAFRLGGVEAEGANESIVKFNKSIAEAAAGKDKSFLALMTRLRIPVRNAKGEIRSLTDMLPELADAIEANQNPAVRTRMLMELFGKSGAKLAATLGQGGKSLKDLLDELQRSGRVLSAGAGASLDKLDEQMEELGVQSRILWAEIVGRGAPAILRLVDAMSRWITVNRDALIQRIGPMVERVANAFQSWVESGGIERVSTELRRAWGVLRDFTASVGGLSGVMKLLGILILAGPVASLVALAATIGRLAIVLVPLLVKGVLFLLGPLGSLSSILAGLRTVFLAMSLSMGTVVATMLPFIVAAGLVAAAAYLIYNNWGGIVSGLRAVWEDITSLAESGVALITGLFEKWDILGKVRAVWTPVLEFFRGIWDRISELAAPVLTLAGKVSSVLGITASPAAPSAGGPIGVPAPTPLIQAGGFAQQRVQGEMRVRFENAPPGMRVDPGTTSSPGLSFNPDVGYRSLGSIG